MHTIALVTLFSSLVVPGALLLVWQKRWRRQRLGQLSPGRVVIAANLVATRRRS